MLLRHSDWASRLDSFFVAAECKEFAYGGGDGLHDCCLFVADAVIEMTGRDLAEEYRNQYRSRREAMTLVKERTGARTLRRFLETSLSSLPCIPVAMAQRGDIVLVKRAREVSLGVIALNGKLIAAASAEGFLYLPLTLGLTAWRV